MQGEVCLVKGLNYGADVWLAGYSALLLNQLWIFVLPTYVAHRIWRFKQKRGGKLEDAASRRSAAPSPLQMWGVYLLLGVLTFAITYLRNLGANALPGSVFSLLISSSIVFNMGFSRLILKRRFTLLHALAAGCSLAAAAVIGVTGVLQGGPVETQGQMYIVGIPCSLGAAACIALMSVLTDKVRRLMAPLAGGQALDWAARRFPPPVPLPACPAADVDVARQGPEGRRDDHRCIVGACTQSDPVAAVAHLPDRRCMISRDVQVASGLIVPAIFVTGEFEQWRPELSAAAHADTKTRTILVLLSCLMPVAKAMVRTGKYETIAHSSAFFFEFVQATAALLSSIASVLIFDEPWTWGYGVALGLMVCGFIVYLFAKRRSRSQAAQAAAKARVDAAQAATAAADTGHAMLQAQLVPLITVAASPANRSPVAAAAAWQPVVQPGSVALSQPFAPGAGPLWVTHQQPVSAQGDTHLTVQPGPMQQAQTAVQPPVVVKTAIAKVAAAGTAITASASTMQSLQAAAAGSGASSQEEVDEEEDLLVDLADPPVTPPPPTVTQTNPQHHTVASQRGGSRRTLI